jgi:acetyltransferase
MSVRNLNQLFRPKSVAVIGASDKPGSVGATVMRNLLQGGFPGPITPVNPRHRSVAGIAAFLDVSGLPAAPDLAVICTPPATIPEIIGQLGQRGGKAAVVLTAGLANGAGGKTLQEAMLQAARPHLLRILGPNCVGLMVPGLGLNASFAHAAALRGTIAFVSQSGALTTAVLDWANSKGIGFSHFVSLGDSADVDFGDVLDYLGSDPDTRAILLYMESIKAARKFMSAARAAARNKPVLAVKAGRAPEGARAAASHTGALAGADEVYDAAIRRAGMLRVYSTEELFDAVETLARAQRIDGERLAIVTNGGGAGVMATDALALSGGRLATLSPATLDKLSGILPPTWSKANPVDIIGDAPIERYVETLRVLFTDFEVDAVLLLHAPTAIVPSTHIARAVADLAKTTSRPLFTCWLGGNAVAEARHLFDQAGIPTYESPEDAVRAFLQIVEYRRNQELLMQTPSSLPRRFAPDTDKARSLITKVLASGCEMLTEPEAKAVLAAYDIPVVETRVAHSAEDAMRIAGELGFPVAVKILSPDVSHKSDVGGAALNLDTPEKVHAEACAMEQRLTELKPNARLQGFRVQSMVRRPNAHELIVGATTDPVFGPVVLFGHGGTAVEVIADRTIGLPPLNTTLAREMIARTRVAKLLAGYRDRPPADQEAISLTLVKVSQLVCDLPEIAELDINPLLADDQGVLALDARIRVAAATSSGVERLAIRPYPKELEEWISWEERRVLLRPIRPEDEPQHAEFFSRLTPEDIRLRFFSVVRNVHHSQLARLTQIDYDREMAFIATVRSERGEDETLGVARAVADPDNTNAEFAVIVRSDLKSKGLGWILLDKLIRYCQSQGIQELFGEVLRHNDSMLRLVRRLGFVRAASADEDTVRVKLTLQREGISSA